MKKVREGGREGNEGGKRRMEGRRERGRKPVH